MPKPRPDYLAAATQLIKVTSEDWASVHAALELFVRETPRDKWTQLPGASSVVLGKNGFAWDRQYAPGKQPVKMEGDGRSPAGVFRLGSAFGYSGTPLNADWPYIHLKENLVAVDDPTSRYYNRIVDTGKIREHDWESAEKMLREDGLYRYGMIIEYNVDTVVPRAGSCIFMHLWRNENTGTEGCTAMAEDDLKQIILWLRPEAEPVIVQAPAEEMEKIRF